MKRINCEVCGSAEMLKENGVFVCQSCGCKYSLEEVRKMLIDEAPTVQLGKVSSSAGQTEEYENMLKATRDAMDDGRFDSAYTNSVRLIAMKPDVPELIAIQALAIWGKEKIALDIPSSTVKGMDRFFSMFETWKANHSEKVEVIVNVLKYVGNACKTKYTLLQEAITALETQKYAPSLADNLGVIADTLGMLGGDLFSTIHGLDQEREGRRRSADNQIIKQQIDRIQGKYQKIDEFRREQIEKISVIYNKYSDDESPEMKNLIEEYCSEEYIKDVRGVKYIQINDGTIKCIKCGKEQSIYRKNLGCKQCGASFT